MLIPSIIPVPARFCAKAVTLVLCFLLAVPATLAQSTNEPQREQLLNGLRLLLWEKPGSSEVLLKLRINSGSAFDLAGKSGQMALLGDLLFPYANTAEYFREELGGYLEVDVN